VALDEATSGLAESIVNALFGIGINSDDRAQRLLELTADSDPAVFWQVFHQVWNNCDDTWYLQLDIIEALELNREAQPPRLFWNDEQKAFFDALPEVVTIYRGCSRERMRGVSWTTDKAVAEGFARGHRGITVPDAIVAEYRIAKPDIITVMPDIAESEVIIDPRGIEISARPL
jgi:hypothetical protein